MKRYEKYKPSGIEWIGEVPEHWEVMPFKFRMDINNGMDYKHIQVEDGFPVMGSGGQFACASKYLYDGEAVLLGRKGTVDKPLYFNGKFWVVDTMFYAIPIGETCCRYMYYQATTFPFSYYQTATALPSMTQTDLGDNRVCVPPYAEQEAIAAYLDARCGDIDKVVATQEKRIALLNEMKQSIITQAVTRGLNPDTKMKDSGVEWIGMVPEHWEKCRFKNFMVLMTKPSDSLVKIGLENIESRTGKFVSTDSEFEGNGTIFQAGDILYGKLRPYLQKVWLAEFDGNAVGDFFVFRAQENSEGNYLKYLLLSDGFTKEANGATEGAKMPRVSSEFILSLKFCLPSREEQKDIADFLDGRCAEIDKQIEAVTRQIELLREYKQSLITEVVTGKRKVC